MQTRRLGRSDLQVAPLAFGGNVFGWSVDEATTFELLDAFVDAGFNLVDTADVYSAWAPGNSGGESETLIGKWLKRSGKRDRVVIATKVGKLPARKGLSAKNIALAAEDSLQRLQTEVIDLYQAHADDADASLEETLGAFAKLIEQGKVRAIGASNYGAARLSEALATSARSGLPRYETLQPHYNLCERAAYEHELEPIVQREGLSTIGYYSLASGFLTGKYRSAADLDKSRARAGGVRKYLEPRGLALLQVLDAIAATHHASVAQVALAWLMARPGVAAPIASATSVAQLRELTGAATLQLSEADFRLIDGASAPPP